MKIFPFLRKETFWARRKIGVLLLVLLLIPAFFFQITHSFEKTVPTSMPVTLIPRDDNVSIDDMRMIKNVVEPFVEPKISDSQKEAIDSLLRERNYAVLEVPPGLTKSLENAHVFRIYLDGGMVPVQKSSEYLYKVMSIYLQELPINIRLELRTVGNEKTISEYLTPSFLLLVIVFLGLFYIPHTLMEDKEVLDRVRSDASLGSMIIGKLAFHIPLIFIPVLVFRLLSGWFGASLQILTWGTAFFYTVTFVYFACLGVSVTFFFNCKIWGRVFNLLLGFFFITFSSFFYPTGFFGSQIQNLFRHLPTSYSVIGVRGLTLKSLRFSVFLDWAFILLLFTLFTFFLLWTSIRYYEERLQ